MSSAVRQLWPLRGGIHPPEEKHLSNAAAIRDAGLADQLVLPLRQHVGASAKPCVNVGDFVLTGQRIADAAGAVSAAIHAPSSGHIVAIEARPIPHPSGLPDLCIVIAPDGKDRWIERTPIENWADLAPAKLLERVREAGIAGLGGAGFPTAVKLAGGHDGSLQTLILNGVECEPYITADDVLMRYRADEIVAGARILMHLSGTTEALIVLEDNKPEAIAALQRAEREAGDPRIEIVVIPTRYPSGGEKQLIQIVTGREVPSGGLPADLGILCQNVGTAVAVRRAIEDGEPLIRRVTTVTGRAVDAPGNFDVRLGTPFAHLLSRAELATDRLARLVMGGSMMGVAMHETSVPIVKTTNCILAATAAEFPDPAPEQSCIRCGMCEIACPAGLLPQQLYWFSRAQELDAAREHALMDCIECGACAWVCPSAIPLVQYYRHTKAAIRQQDADAVRAERSRERFEHRQARIEAELAEREARKRARADAARKKAEAKAAAPAAESAATAAAPPKEAPGDGSGGGEPAPAADRAARAAVVAAALERAGAPPPKAADAGEQTAARKPDPRARHEALAARIEKTRADHAAALDEGDGVRAGKLEAKIKGMEGKLEALRAESDGTA